MPVKRRRAASTTQKTGKSHITDNVCQIPLMPFQKKVLLDHETGEFPADIGIRHFSVLSHSDA
jgi:hypothetical protein